MAQQLRGKEDLLAEWLPALRDGLDRAGVAGLLADGDVGMAFYGDLFRPPGEVLAVGERVYRAGDVAEGFESELLAAWWAAAAETDPSVVAPGADTLVRTPRTAQTALRALSASPFMAGLALRTMVGDLKQVSGYLLDPVTRLKTRRRVSELLTGEVEVVVAHSLGSVVAYEALCAVRLRHRVRAFVTVGSPLGIRNLIFDRLRPSPGADGIGAWPGDDNLIWTNLADAADVVALEKDLGPRFGRVRNIRTHNGAHAHDIRPYLTERRTGEAIAAGLR
ncbi:hypothetical protein [Actinacidiphila acididurans]|uniref:Alpha/beta hydrolase family protein n=1 Tax=Actinacidiphila acididurans TaxID=2784346 RepID=A0ABS2TY87_9ACTN|nr:hypothetical protein [Actinacidiphila acididurans]MBM9506903.1 hypothetical protein [Actinacidiphila acididurans]